ncbi:MAG TPA: FAD-dependent oxidoreductase [Solirubrobacteraceae bacterium]|nr:FAD-dependent oxidoreductase [Solirubrobacteraceae bacterium]
MAVREVEHLLVGGGIASASAARELRDGGADGSMLLVGRELDAPYHRPPCSKGYLRGTETREQALVLPADWWEQNDVELMLRTSVMSIDADARVAKLSNKEEVKFGTALVATGAMVRRLNVDGSGLDGIHYLRALGNADAIRSDAEKSERVVLVGGSYIGCEVAASLTSLGLKCTIVMQEAVTLERAFGPQAGRFFMQQLTDRGIEVVGEDEIDRFEGTGEGDDARVSSVVTKGGKTLPCDMVVAGVGAMPDVMLARKTGLELGELGGVRCSAQLETSVPGIYAAGDMAEFDSVIHGGVMRIEHEDVAAEQGRTAAHNMLGRGRAHDTVPYFFSDLADWASLEYVGPAHEWDEEITRGSIADGSFSNWYLKDGRVMAALAVQRSEDLDVARALIVAGTPLGARKAELADEGSDLASLAS